MADTCVDYKYKNIAAGGTVGCGVPRERFVYSAFLGELS